MGPDYHPPFEADRAARAFARWLAERIESTGIDRPQLSPEAAAVAIARTPHAEAIYQQGRIAWAWHRVDQGLVPYEPPPFRRRGFYEMAAHCGDPGPVLAQDCAAAAHCGDPGPVLAQDCPPRRGFWARLVDLWHWLRLCLGAHGKSAAQIVAEHEEQYTYKPLGDGSC